MTFDCPRCGHCCPQPAALVELSQYEIDRVVGRLQVNLPDFLDLDAMTKLARAIEAKLKEKNT